MRGSFVRALLLVLLLLAGVVPEIRAAENWIRLTTPHFEMYTTNNAKQGTAALKVFEQVRYFFLQNSKSKSAPSMPVKIIAFRSEKEFKPYRFNEGGFAYYLRSRKLDYIVMQDINAEHNQAAIHEYTHLIIQNLDLKLPVWFNEGMADLYSSLEPRGNQAMVGRPLMDRLAIMREHRWLDLNMLFNVEQDSPYYNEKDKMSIFYAQSWALTHMLALGRKYTEGFPKFLAAVAAGRPVPECLQSIYGKSLPQVTKDLQEYLSQNSVSAALFDVKLEKHDLEPEVAEPSQLNVDLTLADLLASQKRTLGEAEQRYARLAAAHPESADVQESLGYLAWSENHADKARECFKLAIDRGSRNPEVFSHYAELSHNSGVPPQELVPFFRRVVELKPDYPDGWLQLGMAANAAHQYAPALDALAHIKNIKPDRAYALFSNLAYCYLRLDNFTEASKAALRAKEYATTPEQSLQVTNLLQDVDSGQKNVEVRSTSAAKPVELADAPPDAPERPTLRRRDSIPRDQPTVHWPANLQHVEATAKFFDCDAHNLRVLVDSREMLFSLDQPDAIIVRNKEGGYIDFQCGPQKPFKVGIFYIPAAEPSNAQGKIRELVF